jgi:hypothetical protein
MLQNSIVPTCAPKPDRHSKFQRPTYQSSGPIPPSPCQLTSLPILVIRVIYCLPPDSGGLQAASKLGGKRQKQKTPPPAQGTCPLDIRSTLGTRARSEKACLGGVAVAVFGWKPIQQRISERGHASGQNLTLESPEIVRQDIQLRCASLV